MPIQEQNIKFLASQVMDDVPEGGGAATGNEIPDGVMNNVFEDISDLDRAMGRFNLRKLFLAVRTLSIDLFGGAKTVVTALPEDPAIGYTLFTTNDPFDTRAQAANRVEAYLFRGAQWNGNLFGQHIEGMREISVIQREGTPLPTRGKTLCLVQAEGEPDEIEQYVRVTDATAELRTFNVKGPDGQVGESFDRLVVKMTLSDALRYDFNGFTVEPHEGYNYSWGTKIRDTTVADATHYYGAQRLSQPAAIGDRSVRADSIFTQLAPSAQTETPLANQISIGTVRLTVDAGDGHNVEIPQSAQTLFRQVTAENRRLNWIETLDARPAPGTMSVAYMAQGNWYVLQDQGDGTLAGSSPALGAGTLDYETRTLAVTLGALPDAGSQIMFAWGSAVHYAQRTTGDVSPPVYHYVLGDDPDADPAPIYAVERGSVTITWQANGTTKTLSDDASNILDGDGVGVIDYKTGALWMKPAVLPDPQSTPVVTYQRATTQKETFTPSADGNGFITVTLGQTPIEPGSIEIEWETKRTKTASEKESGKTGQVSYYRKANATTDVVKTVDEMGWTRPVMIRDRGVIRRTTLSDGSTVTDELTTEQKTALSNRTKERNFFENDTSSTTGQIVVRKVASDDGAGEIIGPQMGTADYDTGEIRWYPRDIIRSNSFGMTSGGAISSEMESDADRKSISNVGSSQKTSGWGEEKSAGATAINKSDSSVSTSSGGESTAESGRWGSESFTDDWEDTSAVTVRYTTTSATFTPQTETLPTQPLEIVVNPYNAESVVPKSVRFRLAGDLYRDDGLGSVIHDSTDTVAGAIDYAAGQILMSWWVGGSAPTIEILSCLSQYGIAPVTSTAMRTQLSPLMPQSLQITATAIDGTHIIGNTDEYGEIQGDTCQGWVNADFGIVQVAFGEYRLNPETEEQEWIARPIDPSTIRYNAVAYSYLPLDADLLGIDAVRLPSDGRVPIYRPGNVVMIMHPQDTAPQTVANGDTIATRPRIGWVRVMDANGQQVAEGYSLDRATGTVTFDDVTGIAMPVTVKHTVGDLRLVTDVQITGDITLSRPLTHDYPANETIVASCLIHGDRRARVAQTWDEKSWTGEWKDSIEGDEATATLNLIDHPITVTNEGCDTDRWLFRCTNAGSNAWELISEKRGLVWSGTYTHTGDDVAPINPRTLGEDGGGGVPYMTIPAAANGGGWSTGNVIRINTVGAIADFWIARAIQQSDEPLDDGADGCEIYALGNIDRP